MNRTRAVIQVFYFTAVLLVGYLAMSLIVAGFDNPLRWFRPPSWDQSAHGVDGILFAEAIRNFSLTQFLQQLGLSAYWPPLFPFLEVPVFLIFGYDFGVARSLVSIIGAISLVTLAFCGFQLSRKWGWAIGGISALLMATNIEFILHSQIIMLEVPGILMITAALLAYLNFLRLDFRDPDCPEGNRIWAVTCLMSSLVFFTKYNYGIMWIIPMIVFETFRRQQPFRELAFQLRKFGSKLSWRDPFHIFLLSYVAFLMVVQISGGWNFDLLGHPVYLQSIWGNPLYFLVLLSFGRLIWLFRKDKALFTGILIRIDVRLKYFYRFLVLPIAIWMAYPPNFNTFLLLVINDSKRQSLFSLETLTFYPKVFINEFSVNPTVGLVVLVSAFASLILWRILSTSMRFVVVAFYFNFLACVIHPNYIPRYLLTACPFIYLAAMVFWSNLIERFVKQSAISLPIVFGCWISCFLFFLPGPSWMLKQTRTLFEASTLDPGFNDLADFICDQSLKGKKNSVIGYSAHLSPSLVAWRCYLKDDGVDPKRVPKTLLRHGFRPREYTPNSLLASQEIKQFFVIEYSDPNLYHRDYLRDFDMIKPLSQELDKHHRYQVVSRYKEPRLGHAVKVFKLM